jgi:hypothetical protein
MEPRAVEGPQMSAASAFFIVDWVVRPFAKIAEKMPLIMLGILLLVYGYVAFLVFRSVQAEHSS